MEAGSSAQLSREELMRHRRATRATSPPRWSGRLLAVEWALHDSVATTPEKSSASKDARDDGGLSDEPVAGERRFPKETIAVNRGKQGGRKGRNRRGLQAAKETTPTIIHPWNKPKQPELALPCQAAELLTMMSDSDSSSSSSEESEPQEPIARPASHADTGSGDDLSRHCRVVHDPAPPPPVPLLLGRWRDSLGNFVEVHDDWTVCLLGNTGARWTKLSKEHGKDGLDWLWCGSFRLHQVGYDREPSPSEFMPPACLAWRTTSRQHVSIWRRASLTAAPQQESLPWSSHWGEELVNTRHGRQNWAGYSP
eukprot:TRINITY_DN19814_c0_g1_i1.p1 TRINITY_DN19814_c0_g1~~TRINITY_DN19814_c0_g1_i1.p1  ORF type:complete len:323 (+),score=43.23 TRINITY_DN19814_c0_g1_i1:41-970(+)